MGLKNVQISEELFIALLKYHLVEIDDVLPEIKNGLEEKLKAMIRRDLYTKYKTAPTEEEREKARQEYLEKVGMHRSFRWQLRRKPMLGVMAKVDYTCKPSAYESEIYPSHKSSICTLCISPCWELTFVIRYATCS